VAFLIPEDISSEPEKLDELFFSPASASSSSRYGSYCSERPIEDFPDLNFRRFQLR
jgi:hypothetical protein